MPNAILRPLDHWRLVRRKPSELAYFRRVFVTKEALLEGQQNDIDIMHETDYRCCKVEPWLRTFALLIPPEAGWERTK